MVVSKARRKSVGMVLPPICGRIFQSACSPAAKSWLCIAFVVLVWGITFVNTRALLADFSAFEILVLRFLFAYVVLCACGRSYGGAKAMRRQSISDNCLCAAMGFSSVFAYQFLENSAIYYTNASNVAILASFGPVITALMMWTFAGKRRPRAIFFLGSGIAIGGITMVNLNGILVLELRPLGDLLAFGAMMSWGVYSVLLDKVNERGIPPLVAVRKAFGWSLVMMAPVAAWGATDIGRGALDGLFGVTLDAAANMERFSSPANWMNICFLGVFASAACFVLLSAACRTLGVVRTTVALYLIPVIGVVFAVAFLGEPITWMSGAGATITIIGVATANEGVRRKA